MEKFMYRLHGFPCKFISVLYGCRKQVSVQVSTSVTAHLEAATGMKTRASYRSPFLQDGFIICLGKKNLFWSLEFYIFNVI